MDVRAGPVGVAIVGPGMISEDYLTHLVRFPDLRVVAVGGRDARRAEQVAAEWKIPRHGSVEQVLADPDVEIVLNLTVPAAHASVTGAALSAGKHVWSEKPLATDRASARTLVDLAAAQGLRLGAAPDTMLGASWQAARRVIASGAIGTPLSAVTSFQWQGPELFHPHADFLYGRGAGPLFDIGPYHVTALVSLLGPIASVAATGATAQRRREIRVGPRAGERFPVDVPTHLSILMTFESGVIAQSMLSFDSALARGGAVEVNGSTGTLVLPDPNRFDGAVEIVRLAADMAALSEQRREACPVDSRIGGRGLGVLDMARALRAGTDHATPAELAYHVLDCLVCVEESLERQAFVEVASSPAPTEPLPAHFDPLTRTLADPDAN